jgi:type IV pilus assembly protein PilQ
MKARRLIVSLVLLALTLNASVLARSGAAETSNTEGQAFTLVSLKHETAGGLTRILIESNAPPLYTVFRPSDKLLVIDLPGGEASSLAPQYAVKSALVDAITVRQSRVGGSSSRAVARIEVAVRGEVRDRSTVSGNTLVIELSPASSQATARQAEAKQTSARRAVSEPSTAGVEVYTAPKAASVDRAPAQPNALRPATLIRAVRSETADGAVRIVVDADGATQFKDFLLPNPWRVVVDITGVRSAFGNKTSEVGSATVERVRVGQPDSKTVRVVVDTKSKLPYSVEREGQSLVITVGARGAARGEKPSQVAGVKAENKVNNPAAPAQASSNVVKTAAQPPSSNVAPEVKVAGQRVEKENAGPVKTPSSNGAKATNSPGVETVKPPTVPPSNLVAQTSQAPSKQAASVRETVTQSVQSSANRTAMDVQRPSQPQSYNPAPPQPQPQPSRQRPELAFCESGYVGGLISFDLRAGVDLRDMLRFVSQQYGVNFIIDKSVAGVPVDLRITDLPWNRAIESVLRANRLGAVCESDNRVIRIATLSAIKEEEEQKRAVLEERNQNKPLVTKIVRLKYARASGSLASATKGGGSGNAEESAGGGGGGGRRMLSGLLPIINGRLSKRGRIDMDGRTNSLIITDFQEKLDEIEDLIAKLDKPEPQVEIEARIVIASRNFLRDIGNELGAAAINGNRGSIGFLQTSPLQLQPGGKLAPGGKDGASGGSSGSSGSSGESEKQQGLGPNLIGPFADTALRSQVPNTVLSLTTGLIGTSIISAALSASETKGHIRTIAAPRITAQDNETAEIINGVQIPVQTVSNNTITTTFVTAALRLEITPQIIEDTGEVLMKVVAENNTVNFALAGQFNNGTPGINTQSAESVVRISDGGTTVMGGINIDTEGHTVNRTPGVSSIPVLGNLFKRKTTRRDSDEILFFITPRIVRGDGTFAPHQRSSVEGMPNPAGFQRVTAKPGQTDSKQSTASSAVKGGQ